MIQKQTWKDEIRILITDEENHGSVQISIPLYVSDIFGKADALIYALWVDVVYRRNGVAQRLLQLAEQQAKLNGVKKIGLEFDKDESDSFVLDWYLRSGYKLFDKKSNLLILKSATYRVSWEFTCKTTKILLLYIFLAQQKCRRHKIPLPHKAT
jgi:ribosomal protein S18 acetylase RimI-like enzyme